MKLLWLACLSRPDILVAVTLLAAKVTTWSINEDRMVARLVGYVSYSAHYSSIWFIADASQSLSFSCMSTPTSEVVFTQLDQPAVVFSPLRVHRRLRCSLGDRDARRLFHVPQLKLRSYPFLLLSSPMRCLCLKFGSSLFLV